MESYASWGSKKYISNKDMRRMKKKMKKSYELGDKLKEKNDNIHEIEEIEADEFLKDSFKNL